MISTSFHSMSFFPSWIVKQLLSWKTNLCKKETKGSWRSFGMFWSHTKAKSFQMNHFLLYKGVIDDKSLQFPGQEVLPFARNWSSICFAKLTSIWKQLEHCFSYISAFWKSCDISMIWINQPCWKFLLQTKCLKTKWICRRFFYFLLLFWFSCSFSIENFAD